MALSENERKAVGEIVEAAVAKGLLAHFSACPQMTNIETLFRKAEAHTEQLNGVASSLARVSDNVAASEAAHKVQREADIAARKLEREAAEAASRGRKEGIRIGVAVALMAGSSGSTAILMRLFGL